MALGVLGVAFAAAVVGGCVDWRLGSDAADNEAAPPEDVWTIRPERMRVYPSTRLVVEDGKPVLEARIEFTDAAGDPTKAVGDLRFELYPLVGTGERRRRGDLLYRWRVRMFTLEENRTFYDPITRAYLFRLRMDDPLAVGNPLQLNVTYLPPRGHEAQRLESTFHLNVPE